MVPGLRVFSVFILCFVFNKAVVEEMGQLKELVSIQQFSYSQHG
jgi:hypothetical protein